MTQLETAMRVALLLSTAACREPRGETGRPIVHNVAPTAERSPCSMIQAMLAIESDAYQRIYADSIRAAPSGRLLVEVRANASLVPTETTCPGRPFSLFHGETNVDWMIVRLVVYDSKPPWNFLATRFQPYGRANPDGSFESAQYYGAAIGGFVEWTSTGWRTFVDVDRSLERPVKQ